MSMEIQSIVVDIHDPVSDDQPTLEAARAIASKTGARIYLFHNVFHRNFLGQGDNGDEVLGEARDLLLDKRHQQLESCADRYRGESLSIECAALWSDEGWLELNRFAEEHHADLVIGVTRPHTRWERLTLSNEDWQLIRYCPTPLLLVRPGSTKEYARVLAALDPLHADDKPASLDHGILAAAGQFRSLYGSEIHALNVVTPVLSAAPTVAEPLLATDTMAQEAATKAHARRVDQLLEQHQLNRDHANVVVGEPADEIVSFVTDNDVDLLVMGAVARSALGRLLIGNTAERVLDAVDCDLLIVKPKQTEAG